MATQHILIVDDDPHIREVVRIAAETSGMRTTEASNGQIALIEFARSEIDLVVLDIGMPQLDGFEFCKAIRTKSDVPILFLTARDDEVDRVLGFELGADDFVTKPFSPRELMLRFKAILARGKRMKDEVLMFGALRLEPAKHDVSLSGKELPLTATEFAFLETFMRNPRRVFNRNDLIEVIYGGSSHLSGRTIDSHIRNIRAKAAERGCPDILDTVHGVGVRLGACSG
ncbi:MAG: response regulator transcription factor [Pseudomonadota bacterium]